MHNVTCEKQSVLAAVSHSLQPTNKTEREQTQAAKVEQIHIYYVRSCLQLVALLKVLLCVLTHFLPSPVDLSTLEECSSGEQRKAQTGRSVTVH